MGNEVEEEEIWIVDENEWKKERTNHGICR